MSDASDKPGNGDDFEAFLREFLAGGAGGADLEKFAEAAGLPKDPAALAAAMNQIRSFISSMPSDGSTTWKLALDQARSIAAKDAAAITDAQRELMNRSVNIANLWLSQVTEIAASGTEPKFLTRELWVQDAFGLIKQLAAPVADRMGEALSEALQENAGEEDSQAVNQAGSMVRWLGNSMIAMQLGAAIGELSREVISAGDIGLPLFTEQRAAFVLQNLDAFAKELEVEVDQVYIYLAIRELAHAGLFKQARWLRDHVIQQIQTYARDIHIDNEKVRDLASDFDPAHPEKLQEAIRDGQLLAGASDEQRAALESIETMLALIEGWVDAVTAKAAALLPKADAIHEAVRRRRASGGPAEKTFGTLIGLQLRPRRLRDASAVWTSLGDRYGNSKRDELWGHPDLLPTALELSNPDQLFARLDDSGDELDRDLRNLLDQ
jgi:putative hydrolase